MFHNPIPHISMVSPPSWAPQGSQMAFFACAGETQCGVYLLDAATDQARWLSAISGSGMPPLWKPDGTQIAFIMMDPDEQMVLYVLQVSDGMQLYTSVMPEGEIPEDAPVKDWGVEVSLEGSGFDGCTGAP
jgi:Tol biopolymer transport system component